MALPNGLQVMPTALLVLQPCPDRGGRLRFTRLDSGLVRIMATDTVVKLPFPLPVRHPLTMDAKIPVLALVAMTPTADKIDIVVSHRLPRFVDKQIRLLLTMAGCTPNIPLAMIKFRMLHFQRTGCGIGSSELMTH
jgi:hypothetical protein